MHQEDKRSVALSGHVITEELDLTKDFIERRNAAGGEGERDSGIA